MIRKLLVRSKPALHVLLVGLFLPPPLLADVVELRSGERLEDVRARPFGESHRIYFPDGRVRIVPNTQIRSLRPGPTTWTRVKRPEAIKPKQPEQAPRFPEQPEPEPEMSVPEVAEPPEIVEPGRDWGPVMKSAILPGWGQYSLDRHGSAAIYVGGTLLLFSRYWSIRSGHRTAEADYNDPVPVGAIVSQSLSGNLTLEQAAITNLAYLAEKERRVFQLQNEGNNILLLLGLLWGWNMFDVIYGGQPWEKQWIPDWKEQTVTTTFEWTGFHVRVGLTLLL